MEEPLLDASSSRNSLVLNIVSMGFSRESVEALVENYPDIDLSTALQLLGRSVSSWEHGFSPLKGATDYCAICGDRASSHAFLEFSISAKKSERSSQSVEANNEMCGVCLLETQEVYKLECGHSFCKECVVDYLTVSISEGKVMSVKCPQAGCFEVFTADRLETLLPDELLAKYRKFKSNQEVEQDPSARWCPNPNCGTILRARTDTEDRLDCTECGMAVCFVCGEKWHPDKTCEEAIDQSYKTWAQGKPVQQCPQCRRRVEKEDGCNHVACHVCHYEWCWLCRSQYSPMHYSPINPFGCPGLQGEAHTTERWPCYKLCALRFFLCILMPFSEL